jgi:nudix-type nucleoside diphosphatase (YffH/AdpP family)
MIAPEHGASAPGVLVAELSEDDVARLSHYEGGFRYDLRPVRVSCSGQAFEAEVFFPVQGQGDPGGRWSLEDWAARHGEVSMRAAQEIMGWYGRMPARELARRFGPINNRAASYVAAQGFAPDPDRDVARDVVVHAHNRPYLNFFAVEEMDLQYRRHDGTMSAVLNRAALFVGQAVVVLPYDPVRDVVLLIEQFRAPLFIAGDRAPWVWEPIAGLIDRGEAPFRAAVREAEEEAGLVLGRLEPAGGVYSSTGSSTEFLHLFIGISDLPDVPEGGGGLDGEGEDIRAEILSYDALMHGVDAHSYRDMPLVTCALWLARHRDRLRAEAGISGSA